MIAALPMYDFPALRGPHDRLWAGIRGALQAEGIAAPPALARPVTDLQALWRSPDLVLAQTCGLPYRAALHGRVTLLAAPDHRLPGCAPGHYRSALVVRADDPRQRLAAFAGAPVAINDPMSQSGWAALHAHLTQAGVAPGPVHVTGSHLASARAVADGQAALAALDAVSWTLLRRIDPAAGALRVLELTVPTPALPYIAAAGADAPALRRALAAGIAGLTAADRAALALHGIAVLPAAAWLALPLPPKP